MKFSLLLHILIILCVNFRGGTCSELLFPEEKDPGCYKSPNAASSSPPQATLIEHAWLGSAVDNWILKFLAEEQLGVGVRMITWDAFLAATQGNGTCGNYTGGNIVDLEYWVYPSHIIIIFVLAKHNV